MKKMFLMLVASCLSGCGTLQSQQAGPSKLRESESRQSEDFDDTVQFIFHSVLEGLYEDGVSNAEVDQILMKKEKQSYFHFIYACPVCGATIWALETYRSRPDGFYGMKDPRSTFGKGLPAALHDQLYSDQPTIRLTAINSLVKKWIGARMDKMNLTKTKRAELLAALEAKRKQGMEALESFRKNEHGGSDNLEVYAPAFVNLSECAACNGAVGKPMKLPGDKSK